MMSVGDPPGFWVVSSRKSGGSGSTRRGSGLGMTRRARCVIYRQWWALPASRPVGLIIGQVGDEAEQFRGVVPGDADLVFDYPDIQLLASAADDSEIGTVGQEVPDRVSARPSLTRIRTSVPVAGTALIRGTPRKLRSMTRSRSGVNTRGTSPLKDVQDPTGTVASSVSSGSRWPPVPGRGPAGRTPPRAGSR